MAISVRGLYFSFTKVKPTLNCVNLNVDESSIYALLGPSGCGKTTLLDIIIGVREPKSGTVLLYGYKTRSKESGVPGAGIGYMPQNISLQFDFTIGEILVYFGKLHFMSPKQIEIESERLIKTFNLPDKNRLIGNLSGGQQRLVSLAIALIHKPRLLILDEPTVGVDPLLRSTMWDYLINLSVTQNVTTLITTHYVDEAKRANVVSFMRKGEILCQGKPQQLLQTHNCNTLDEFFLLLCSQQGPRRQSLADIIAEDNSYEIVNKKQLKTQNVMSPLRKYSKVILILLWKHFIEFKRNPFALLMLFLISISTVLAVTAFFGNPPIDIPIAWVVDGIGHKCDFVECIEMIEQQSGVNTTSLKIDSDRFESENNFTSSDDPWRDYVGNIPYLTDTFRKSIDKEIIALIDYSNISIAMQDFKELRVNGIIHIGVNFSENFLRCDPFIIPDVNCDLNDMIESGSIKLFIDPTNSIIHDSIKVSVEYSVYKFREQVVKQIGVAEHVARLPLNIRNFDESPMNLENLKFVWFAIPGFLITVPFVFSAAVAVMRLVSESDVKVRNYISGVKLSQIFLSEIIVQFLIMSMSSLINLFTTIYLFHVPCESSIFLVITLMLLQIFLGLTLGLFLSSLFNNSMLSLFTSIMILIAAGFTNGCLWSIEAQPIIIQYVNYALPLPHSVKSMRFMMLKKDAPFYPQISNGFAFSVGWIILFYSAAILIAKFKK